MVSVICPLASKSPGAGHGGVGRRRGRHTSTAHLSRLPCAASTQRLNIHACPNTPNPGSQPAIFAMITSAACIFNASPGPVLLKEIAERGRGGGRVADLPSLPALSLFLEP